MISASENRVCIEKNGTHYFGIGHYLVFRYYDTKFLARIEEVGEHFFKGTDVKVFDYKGRYTNMGDRFFFFDKITECEV